MTYKPGTYYARNRESVLAKRRGQHSAKPRKYRMQLAGTYYERNKEKILARARTPAYRARARKYATDVRRAAGILPRGRSTPEVKMLSSAKRRAKECGVPFALCVSDIVVPTHCPALGIVLSRSVDSHSDCSPSLDRIIPDLGYVRGNVAVVSHLANAMKNKGTPEQLTALVKWLKKVYPQWLLI